MKKNIFFIIGLLFLIITANLFSAKESTLFSAVESKNLAMVKRYVEMGASLNSLNKDGKTILDIATERKYNKICRYLLKNGAKVTSYDTACILEKNLKRRRVLMTVFGVLFGFGIIGVGIGVGLLCVAVNIH